MQNLNDHPAQQPTPQGVADRWAAQLMNLIKEHGHVHLLLDRFNGLDERLQPLVDILPEQWPLTDPYFGEAIERTPLLVKLTMAQLSLADLSALVAAEAALDPAMPLPSVCAWICADVSTERLAGQLRRQLDVRVQGSKKSSFFCYFDPRVMPHLPRALEPAQMARLFGHVSLWVAPRRNGELLKMTKPDVAMAFGGLRLNPAQAQALGRIGLLNQVISSLAAAGSAWPVQEDAKLDQWLVQAQQKGHAEQADQLAYVLHAALVHPSFDTHPEVAQALAAAQRDGTGLCAALDSFDDAFWESVRRHGPQHLN